MYRRGVGLISRIVSGGKLKGFSYQTQFGELQSGILLVEVVPEVEREDDPEHCARTPDQGRLPEAGRELRQVGVPSQVPVPERTFPAEALEGPGVGFLVHRLTD